MEGHIHCLLGWVGALARPSLAIFRNYRSVDPGITMTALAKSRRFECNVGMAASPQSADTLNIDRFVRVGP
jgi:hypothetical protein